MVVALIAIGGFVLLMVYLWAYWQYLQSLRTPKHPFGW